jgi:type I restriction enzyme S subunit
MRGAICAELDAEVAQFKEATSRLEREIELLREYRTRLVADVVTGKLDVRSVKCEGGSVNESDMGEAVDAFGDDVVEVEDE